jgi:putative FmdB family regulatory protein
MPSYEYECRSCQSLWEENQRITDPPREECPTCGKKTAIRLISRSSFSLLGGGWSKDNYSKPST